MIKQFETAKGKGLLVKLPDDMESYTDGVALLSPKGHNQYSKYSRVGKIGDTRIPLPKGNWQLLGNPFELTEEQAQMVVDRFSKMTYVDYEYPKSKFWDAKSSLKSLLMSLNVYEVNPYGEKEPKKQNPQLFGNSLAVKTLEWNQAQANTGRWVILFETKN